MGAESRLRVEVLGPIRVRLGDAEVRLGPTRQRALFAVLAIRHQHVVAREDLIHAVWGEQAPATAQGSVFTYVSGLRRALEPDRSSRASSSVLRSEGHGYRLALDADALDATVFAAHAGTASAAVERGAADEALTVADEALALWRGEPLTGLPGPFLAAQRDRLMATRLDLLETRAKAKLMAGRHAELVGELTALVGEYPLHEELRGLLMIALYRCGRQADALDQFRQATRTLGTELGTAPGARLAEIHQQVLTNDPALAPPKAGIPAASARSTGRPRQRAVAFVGRDDELAQLRTAAAELVAGTGRAVWLDGEPGIGKSELLTEGLAGLDVEDVEMCWGSGDVLAQRFPLEVIQECLGVAPDSPDPRRARIAHSVARASAREDVFGGGTTPLGLVDEVVRLVGELCRDRPLALVVDAMQWADELSMLTWSRLVRETERLPLLLVGACRPVPRTEGLDSMRSTVARQGGITLRLDRLSGDAVAGLVREIVKAEPGPELRRVALRAAGNPLYLQELVDALVRDQMVRVSAGTADIEAAASAGAPRSLASALEHRLDFLTPATVDVLRRAALLGMEFRLDDLAVVLDRPSNALLAAIDESTTARVLVVDGDRTAFRHPLVREALYEGTGPALRSALHRQAAERLHQAGASVHNVARQLAAAPGIVDPWIVRWVGEHGEQVAGRAPDIGLELLHRVVAACDPGEPRLVELTASLARVMYWSGESPEHEVRSVLAATRDPDLAGEMYWILGCVFYRRGLDQQGVDVLRVAVESGISDVWRARCRALLSGRERMGLGEVESAERNSVAAIRDADRYADVFAKAYAQSNLWLFRSIDRDHAAALDHVDDALRSLDAAPEGPENAWLVHMRLSLLDNRVFSLQNLDRLDEAGQTLRRADAVVREHQLPGGLTVSSAVHDYWTGDWDQAMAELSVAVDAHGFDMAFRGLRESGPMLLLLHGVAALIAVLRDDRTAVVRHLTAADELPLLTSADRENCDFLVIADALAAERDGRHEAALLALTPVLDERYSPLMLRHQWLADAARIAVEGGDRAVAERALEVCELEARRERTAARATAAAAHCRGLVLDDPAAALAAAEHYASVHRPVEQARALEDAAVLLARAQRRDEAREAHELAVHRYDALGARWASRRASTRLRAADPRWPTR
ncbi:AfsR/SARP family transcriptional regulator [Actinophytocola xanthii]|uniref:OmpR/PhoB-type domain-containing protein n=1 Tax=Actinophytocola xanthii TaxID=1912961 RepID=A0A1Q8CTE9_9PSEU|nr:AfsR/SARP family transcriptional regulator [Actinophytocola xanthii]OLF17627.1 hypothetical protein BU204_10445 [Actinophytocola xanthii]